METVPGTMALARGHQLSDYDAWCLDLAITLSVPLATADRALRQTAAAPGVTTF
jgi:predicted nucleic acid-binding protein